MRPEEDWEVEGYGGSSRYTYRDLDRSHNSVVTLVNTYTDNAYCTCLHLGRSRASVSSVALMGCVPHGGETLRPGDKKEHH